MKKKIVIIAIILLVFLLGLLSLVFFKTKNDNQKSTAKEAVIICTKTSNLEDIKIDFKQEITYEGNIAKKIKITETYSSQSQDTLKMYEQTIKDINKGYESLKNYKANLKTMDNTIINIIDIDYTKIDIDELIKHDANVEELLNDKKQVDLQKLKQSYETYGSVCKEKKS